MPTPKLTCPRCGGPVALVDATVTSPWTWERGYLVLPLLLAIKADMTRLNRRGRAGME